MTREEAARRYLEASRAASISTGDAHDAHEGTMRRLEQRHPQVRAHALVGAGEDFDQAPGRNELEHQRELRRQAGITNQQAAARRGELRATHYGAPTASETYQAANPPGAPSPSRARSRSRSAPRRAASAGAGISTGAIGDAVTGRGNLFMQLLGWTLALSLIYLLVAGKGVNALTGVVNAIVGGVRTFVAPIDPIASLETALGATPAGSSSSSSTGATAAASSPAPGSLTPSDSAGTGATDARPPAANTLTWPWLRREVKAGHITKAQLATDEAILTH
jgi:hypothetical protein